MEKILDGPGVVVTNRTTPHGIPQIDCPAWYYWHIKHGARKHVTTSVSSYFFYAVSAACVCCVWWWLLLLPVITTVRLLRPGLPAGRFNIVL